MGVSQSDIDQSLGNAAQPQTADFSETKNGPVENNQAPGLAPAPARSGAPQVDLGRILGLSVPVSVVLAEREMCVEMILATKVGTIIEFDIPFDAELTLQAANQAIGKGFAVKVGENFGLRLTRAGSVSERLEAMSGSSSVG